MESEQNLQDEKPEEPQQGSSSGEGERLPDANTVDLPPGGSGGHEPLPESNVVDKGQDTDNQERRG